MIGKFGGGGGGGGGVWKYRVQILEWVIMVAMSNQV